ARSRRRSGRRHRRRPLTSRPSSPTALPTAGRGGRRLLIGLRDPPLSRGQGARWDRPLPYPPPPRRPPLPPSGRGPHPPAGGARGNVGAGLVPARDWATTRVAPPREGAPLSRSGWEGGGRTGEGPGEGAAGRAAGDGFRSVFETPLSPGGRERGGREGVGGVR